MTLVCLWAPAWPTGGAPDDAVAAPLPDESSAPRAAARAACAAAALGGGGPAPGLTADLLAVTPHVAWGAGGVVRLDARGLAARAVAREACEVARAHGAAGVRAGVGAVLVAAEVAARHVDASLTVVPSARTRDFLAPFPLAVLAPAPRLAAALADLGIDSCGALGALTREAVEARLGAEAAALWRLARGDDPRLPFAPRARSLPSASVAWEEYALRDPERLVFPANALVGTVCAELRERGEAARQMTLTLTLASRERVARPLRAARASADRAAWLRLVRQELERFTLPDGVVGLALRAEAAGAAEAPQGDLFDRGFQSGAAAEAALARLIDDGDAVLVGLATTAHPLVERRTRWEEVGVGVRVGVGGPGARGAPPRLHDGAESGRERHHRAAAPIVPALTVPALARGEWTVGPALAPSGTRLSLQLLPVPRPVRVATALRRGLRVPVRYHDEQQQAGGAEVVTAAGPDVVAGGRETGEPYAREYFQCLTRGGTLVLLFRDVRAAPPRGGRGGAWYLQGWWD